MNCKIISSLAAALFAAQLSTPATAEACGGAWYDDGPRIDYRQGGVARAERDLAKGKHAQAAAAVLRMIPHISGYRAGGGDKLVRRAQRVLALAIARSDGQLDIASLVPRTTASQWHGDKQATRDKSVAWSVKTLAQRNSTKKANPIAKAELAEAIANLPKRRSEARKLLEELAHSDLLPSANGYALLARLRAQAGDEAGRIAAMKRCSTMAKHTSVCSTKQGVS